MTFEEVHALLNQALIRLSENRAQYNSLLTLRLSLRVQLSTLSPIKVGTKVSYSIPPRKSQNKELLEGTAVVTEVEVVEGSEGVETDEEIECKLKFTLGEPMLTSTGKQAMKNGKPRYQDIHLGYVYLEHLTKVDS